MELVAIPPRPGTQPLVESATSRAYALAPGAPLPPDADAYLDLPDGTRFAYAPRGAVAAQPEGAAVALAIDPTTRGNSFRPIHDSPRALAALGSIAAGRRVDTGPESERVFLFLRGPGLVFEENGDTHRYEPHTVALVAAGEPARVWAQGPQDALFVVFQPKGAPAVRRTLASEIAKRRAALD